MNKLGFGFLRLPVKKGSPDDIDLDLLDHILTKHPEVDLVQLQINYLDWDSASIQSRLCYETARKHHKKIIVMEPVKGGALANPPAEAVRLLRDLSPEESMASFALRFAESLPEVEIVLSGMNTMAQLLDNLKERKPLIPEEQARLMQAARLISRSTAIPCTGCGYCLKSCPKQICIPDYFKLYNEYFRSPDEDWKVAPVYQELTRDHSRAGDCITCRSCEQRCPQKLPVSDYLRRVSKHFDH